MMDLKTGFVYQPTLDTLELIKGTDYALSWKSKEVLNFLPKPLYIAFLHSIKFSEYIIGIKFDKDSLAVEQNSCWSRIVNVYIVFDLDG